MKTIEMGDPKEVEMLLKNDGFLEMNLADLQREHAELIAFNTKLERKQKDAEKIAAKYKTKVLMIADLLSIPPNTEMTLRAIDMSKLYKALEPVGRFKKGDFIGDLPAHEIERLLEIKGIAEVRPAATAVAKSQAKKEA